MGLFEKRIEAVNFWLAPIERGGRRGLPGGAGFGREVKLGLRKNS